jgi:HEAT repeat protein
MTDDAASPPDPPPTTPGRAPADDASRNDRRRAAALAGHTPDPDGARDLLADPDAGVRATALRALARIGSVTVGDVAGAWADAAPEVRRAAAEVVAAADAPFEATDPDVPRLLVALLGDPEPSVVEVAAWATGEWVGRLTEDGLALPVPDPVAALARVTLDHPDALCREAAVAALGAIGDEAALPTILAATGDKATVRRRAVIALAPFDGDEVAAALERALTDRDWQVRQAAEDLLAAAEAADDDEIEDDEDSEIEDVEIEDVEDDAAGDDDGPASRP